MAEMRKILTPVGLTSFCTPATASKFRGVSGFCGTGLFGKACKVAIAPFRQRQYLDTPPWATSHTMERNIEYYLALLDDGPRRSIQLVAAHFPAVGIARDIRWNPLERTPLVATC